MPLPWKAGGEQELLINVNRWRDQMQLPPVGAKDVSNDTHTLNLADAKSDAIVVDLKGRLKAGGMTPPFAGKAAGELPAGHPPVAKSAEEKKPAPPPTTTAKSPSPSSQAPTSAAASQADLPLTFNVPKGWEPTKPAVFAIAGFKATTDAGQVAYFDQPDGRPGGWHVGECESLARSSEFACRRRRRTGRDGASVQS